MARFLLTVIFAVIASIVYVLAGWQFFLIVPLAVGAIIVQRAWLWCSLIGSFTMLGLIVVNLILAGQPLRTMLEISADFTVKNPGLWFVLPIASLVVGTVLSSIAGMAGSYIRQSFYPTHKPVL
jgi:hypothetical protein